MTDFSHYQAIAELFDYPQPDYRARVQNALVVLAERYPEATEILRAFELMLPGEGQTLDEEELDEIQEIFTRSFDVQSITTLGVGYVMFGDDYKRGELLVNLNREQRLVGLHWGSELSDHLPNVLRLLAKWEDPELVVEFVEEVLYRATKRMTAEFETSRMETRNGLYKKHYKTLIDSSQTRGTMFREALRTLLSVLESDFEVSNYVPTEHDNPFLKNLGRELDIEATQGRPTESGRKQ